MTTTTTRRDDDDDNDDDGERVHLLSAMETVFRGRSVGGGARVQQSGSSSRDGI